MAEKNFNMKAIIRSILISFAALISLESYAQEMNKNLSFLALGDSYTIGESVEVSKRWPNQLAQQLQEKGIALEPVKIIAKTGWRSDQLIEAIKKDKDLKKYDLVSLLIGVNNQYQSANFETFKKDFEELLSTATELSNNGKDGVFVLSIPDYGQTPFGASKAEQIAKELDQYNAWSQSKCEEIGIAYYSITAISRRAKEQANLVAKDQLHPSAIMYEKWCDKILTPILEKLKHF